jgi:hypothetical protein
MQKLVFLLGLTFLAACGSSDATSTGGEADDSDVNVAPSVSLIPSN